MTMNQELADITALQAVTYLLEDEKRRDWLMAETGIVPGDLKSLTENPEVLAGVLDFLLAHEDILIGFCESCQVDPTLPARIRPLFPGASLEY